MILIGRRLVYYVLDKRFGCLHNRAWNSHRCALPACSDNTSRTIGKGFQHGLLCRHWIADCFPDVCCTTNDHQLRIDRSYRKPRSLHRAFIEAQGSKVEPAGFLPGEEEPARGQGGFVGDVIDFTYSAGLTASVMLRMFACPASWRSSHQGKPGDCFMLSALGFRIVAAEL